MDVRFRAAGLDDHAATREVADAAFRPEDVVTFLDALRADGCVLGEWLAEDSSGPVGLVVFSRVWVEQHDGDRTKAALLTPLAVRPDRQRLGIGTQLMQHALTSLEARGETLFFVLGHPMLLSANRFCIGCGQAGGKPVVKQPCICGKGGYRSAWAACAAPGDRRRALMPKRG